MGRDAEVERISVVMIDVACIDVGLARLGTRTLPVPVRTVTGCIAPVGMVEVEPAHLVVRIRCSMHVRGPGHEAESRIRHAATKHEDPTHPADCIRGHGATEEEPFSKMVHDPSVRNPWIVSSKTTQALLDAAWAAARR